MPGIGGLKANPKPLDAWDWWLRGKPKGIGCLGLVAGRLNEGCPGLQVRMV